MNRYQRFSRILKTVTRILMARDTQPNRTAAYMHALARAEVIAIRCVRRS